MCIFLVPIIVISPSILSSLKYFLDWDVLSGHKLATHQGWRKQPSGDWFRSSGWDLESWPPDSQYYCTIDKQWLQSAHAIPKPYLKTLLNILAQPSTTILYDPATGSLGLTRDLDAFNAALSESFVGEQAYAMVKWPSVFTFWILKYPLVPKCSNFFPYDNLRLFWTINTPCFSNLYSFHTSHSFQHPMFYHNITHVGKNVYWAGRIGITSILDEAW